MAEAFYSVKKWKVLFNVLQRRWLLVLEQEAAGDRGFGWVDL
jgi:hypothetical protein